MHRLAAVALALTFAPFARAQSPKDAESNWHHWRGPNADGSAPSARPPIKWDAKTNIAWKVELPGRGSATPIMWGDRIFILTAIKTDRRAKPEEMPKVEAKLAVKTEPPTNFYQFVVLCFDRRNGSKLWEKQVAEMVPHEGHHVTHSYAAGSPTTDGKLLYASFGSFGTYALDFDGNVKWTRTDLGRLHTRLGWGEAVTPVVRGQYLLLNYDQEIDSRLICLEAATGKTRWEAKRDEKTTWSTPLVVDFGGKTQAVTNGTARIRSYDLATGAVLWQCGGMTVNPIPSPVRFGDSVVCMSGYQRAAAVSIPLGSSGDLGDKGKVDWRYSFGTPYVPSPALSGELLYFNSTNEPMVTILNAKTGKALIEKERLSQAKNFYASPLAAGGHIFFVDRAGTTVVVKAGESLDVVSVNKLDDPIDASPIAVGNQLFLRGEKYLYCIEAK
ncbi:PQQ-like beta-propeller repeat protein [Gemmata sp. JC673]|uniref:PQQ-like beta-propeller repeat protein n=1 Tax=Gemmata algarum TaxID=2975278 RepID=A0ABU5F572_9BACT|nr:PQQ-binding-like beta-propeller repeat protein [Gemmata algarum]MDY3562731.1 PQQ-like beta-propeller repeat protein [Gemmata algarum]